MALISCGECGNQVSDRATACPNCGNPIATVAAGAPGVDHVAIDSAPVVTTQATGKGPKIVQMIGCLIVVLGVVSCVAAPSGNVFGGIAISTLGAVIYIAGSISAWWSHG